MAKGIDLDLETLKALEPTKVKKAGEETLVLYTPPKLGKEVAGTEIKKFFRLYGFALSVSAESYVKLLDGSTVFFVTPILEAKKNIVIQLPKGGYLSKAEGNKLQLEVSAEAEVTGTFYGYADES